MDDLIAFLSARYDEAEVIARAATPGPWHYDRAVIAGIGGAWVVDDQDDGAVIISQAPTGADVAHIALSDPAAKLRDIAGKRKIVAMAAGQPGYLLPDGVHDGRDPGERECDDVLRLTLFEVLRHLAEESATHPDYNAKDWAQWPTT